MAIRGIDDIERDKNEAERTKMVEETTRDIKDLFNNLKPKPQPKKKKSLLFLIIMIIFLLALLLLAINFLLANVWLLKFFIKELFK